LLARVREHDEAAARELVERLYPVVAQVVHSHLPRRDDPEDLMQEAFLKMFSRLEQFRGEVPFAHWVSRIALNTCLDRLRRQKVRPEFRWSDLSEDEQAVLHETEDTRPAEDADAPAARTLIEKLLAQLPADDAWLLRQVELEQLSLATVCAKTGWNAGAARVRLFRARRRLQKLFRKLEPSPP
jgi:RNA polymerase sigma-70 factor (ECF subfamily)